MDSSPYPFLAGPDEFRRGFRDNRIAVAAQASHSGGYPMSQRECAGFNRPGFSVGAEDPFGPGPESADRACFDSGLPSFRAERAAIISGLPSSQCMSRAVGVVQAANNTKSEFLRPW